MVRYTWQKKRLFDARFTLLLMLSQLRFTRFAAHSRRKPWQNHSLLPHQPQYLQYELNAHLVLRYQQQSS